MVNLLGAVATSLLFSWLRLGPAIKTPVSLGGLAVENTPSAGDVKSFGVENDVLYGFLPCSLPLRAKQYTEEFPRRPQVSDQNDRRRDVLGESSGRVTKSRKPVSTVPLSAQA